MKSLLTAAVMVLALGAWGCSSDDGGDSDGTGGTPSGGTTGAGTTTPGGGVSPGGGTTSGGVGTGGTTGTSTSTVTSADCGTADCTIDVGEFSFFVISWTYIKSVGGDDGLGGNLGGLAGADNHCQAAAAAAGDTTHVWKAFLSTSTVNAIDRIGNGPWYSKNGLIMAPSKAVLGDASARPSVAATDIVASGLSGNYRSGSWEFKNCLTDEYGICPIAYQPDGDNHDILTGSDRYGKYVANGTCGDWASESGNPVFGHIWPRNHGTGYDNGWIEAENHAGGSITCAQAVNQTEEMSVGTGVGAMGGYGAFYCFALSSP